MRIRNGLIFILSLLILTGCNAFKEKPEVEYTSEELYAIAKEDLEKKNWITAIENLQILEAKFPYGTYAEQAQLDIAYAYYKNAEPGLSVAASERFIKLHPTHPKVDYAYYLRALATTQEEQGLLSAITGRTDLSDRDAQVTRDAYDAFVELYTRFPDSIYAVDSRKRAALLLDSLAQHEIVVANYYYSRNAHVATVNRAKGVLEDYPSTPSVEDALGLLVMSYQKMGLDQLYDDSMRVLELNYPGSIYLNPDQVAISQRKLFGSVTGKTTKDTKQGWFGKLKSKFKRNSDQPE